MTRTAPDDGPDFRDEALRAFSDPQRRAEIHAIVERTRQALLRGRRLSMTVSFSRRVAMRLQEDFPGRLDFDFIRRKHEAVLEVYDYDLVLVILHQAEARYRDRDRRAHAAVLKRIRLIADRAYTAVPR